MARVPLDLNTDYCGLTTDYGTRGTLWTREEELWYLGIVRECGGWEELGGAGRVYLL